MKNFTFHGNHFSKVFTGMLFLIFAIHFNSIGQTAVGRPSCNMVGPLEAVASGSGVVITVTVANSSPSPKLSYEFASNSSHAYISSKGPVTYNAATNTTSQQVTVFPGTIGPEFNLKLEVSTAAGMASCSQSVAVSPATAPH